MVDNDSVVDEGDSEFERADVIDDDLEVEDCTPMAENQINRTFSTKKLGRLDETSYQRLSQLDYAPSPNPLSPPNKLKINIDVPINFAPVSENVQEESKDELPVAMKPVRSTGTEKKVATRRPKIDVHFPNMSFSLKKSTTLESNALPSPFAVAV